jgi:hypothetical protein
MRGVWIATAAIVGCGTDAELNAHDEYYALEARATLDCGGYERNYRPSDPVPLHLCGPQPDIACMNAAISGAAIAKLRYSYLDPASGLPREQNYYAGENNLVWIGYYELGFREPAWYRADCERIVAEPYSEGGMTCWTLKAADCIARQP